MSKRKVNKSEYIQNKIRKLEKKISKQKEKLETLEEEPTGQDKEKENPVQPEAETSHPEDALPEEFLLALGEEGKIDEQKGQKIRQEIADRWTNIIKMGLKKENLLNLMNKYPNPENFQLSVAPKLNSEIAAAVSENVSKRDKKLEHKQNLNGKVLSCLGTMLTDIMKGNINSIKLIEGINDAAKILCNMNYYDSMTRKHFILTSVQSCVKEAIINVPTDTYLFGENFSERLKTVKAVEKTGSTIKQVQTFKKQNKLPHQPSNNKNLNWKSPSQRPPHKRYNPKGGQKNQQQHKKPYRPQQSKPAHRR